MTDTERAWIHAEASRLRTTQHRVEALLAVLAVSCAGLLWQHHLLLAVISLVALVGSLHHYIRGREKRHGVEWLMELYEETRR